MKLDKVQGRFGPTSDLFFASIIKTQEKRFWQTES